MASIRSWAASRLGAASRTASGIGRATRSGVTARWTSGAQSRQKYFAAEARATFPRLAGGRLFAEAYASRRDYPMERFFGIGPDSRRSDQTDYLFAQNLVGG